MPFQIGNVSGKQLRWMSKEGITDRVSSTEQQARIDDGWVFGRVGVTWHTRDVEKNVARIKQPRKYTPERQRVIVLKSKYSVTLEWYNSTLVEQGYACGICGKDNGGRVFAVDHDHTCCGASGVKLCGKCTRGLLCTGCNMKLGHVEPTLRWIIQHSFPENSWSARALAYLTKFPPSNRLITT